MAELQGHTLNPNNSKDHCNYLICLNDCYHCPQIIKMVDLHNLCVNTQVAELQEHTFGKSREAPAVEEKSSDHYHQYSGGYNS